MINLLRMGRAYSLKSEAAGIIRHEIIRLLPDNMDWIEYPKEGLLYIKRSGKTVSVMISSKAKIFLINYPKNTASWWVEESWDMADPEFSCELIRDRIIEMI